MKNENRQGPVQYSSPRLSRVRFPKTLIESSSRATARDVGFVFFSLDEYLILVAT